MTTGATLTHRFVRFVPDELEEQTLYVSLDFATVVHKCCCGCGGKVVTPLTPTDWKMTFDGESITLMPSVNNSGFQCESHYFISRSRAEWAPRLHPYQVTTARLNDRGAKDAYYGADNAGRSYPAAVPLAPRPRPSWLTRLIDWCSSK